MLAPENRTAATLRALADAIQQVDDDPIRELESHQLDAEVICTAMRRVVAARPETRSDSIALVGFLYGVRLGRAVSDPTWGLEPAPRPMGCDVRTFPQRIRPEDRPA